MAFDPAQFKKDLVYRARVAPAEILRDIKVIRQQDKLAEARRSKAGWLGGLALAVAVLGGFGTVVALQPSEAILNVVLVVAGGLVVVSVVAFVYRGTQGRFDYEDRRYVLLERILPLVQTDLPKDARLDVRMDLSRPSLASKAAGKGKVGSWKVKYFEDPWLSVSGQFIDGTRFVLEVTERVQLRSKWKRSSSGKMKHKTKSKSSSVASLRLAVKAKRYPALEHVHTKVDGAIQLPQRVTIKSLDSSPEGLSLRVRLAAPWDCPPPGQKSAVIDGRELVASMFLSLYQVLNLAKAVAQGRPRVV